MIDWDLVNQRLKFPAISVRISADLERARQRNIAWMCEHSLLVTAEEINGFNSWRLPELIAYAFPKAHGKELDILVDMLGWYTFVDDYFDGPVGHSRISSKNIIKPMIDTLHNDASDVAGDISVPVLAAWADLWHRQTEGMSTAWRGRAAKEWKACLGTFIDESSYRETRSFISTEDLVPLRRHASCLYPFMNMLERVLGDEVPSLLLDDREMKYLRAHTADIATCINDLYSLEREERQGEQFNMVLNLQRVHGCGRDEAMAATRAKIYQLLDECVQLSSSITQSYPSSLRYVEGIQAMVNGIYLWTSKTDRYALPADVGFVSEISK
ncbi:hypothetical protein OG985_46310 [Streptomyces sp. NBC_00289]|uniref:terpene synthase family protein n=1 Tax=Streptomyces sp. NBC_00289 TaxID=2975703 RepID=UPI0032446D81